MVCDIYASVCGGFWKFVNTWGWDALEKKYNPNLRFREVHIICFNDSFRYRSLRHGTLCIHRVPRPPVKQLCHPLVMTLILANYATRIIHDHNIPLITNLYSNILDDGIPTVLAGKRASIPSMVTVQNEYQQIFKTTPMYLRSYRLNSMMEAYVYRHATHIRCVSEHLVEYVVDQGIPKCKVSFVPRCLDLTTFKYPTEQERAVFVEQYGLQDVENKLVVLCVAKLRPQKNLDRTLEAFSTALGQTGPAVLLIAGRGVLEPKLRETATRLGIDKHIVFLGKIPQSDLRCAYAMSDIFILPSMFEGRSRAIVEALSYGLPVIASNITSTRETIEDGYNGLLVDPQDVSDIASAISHLAKSEDLRRQLGRHAEQRFNECYSAEECYERKADLISSLIDHGRFASTSQVVRAR